MIVEPRLFMGSMGKKKQELCGSVRYELQKLHIMTNGDRMCSVSLQPLRVKQLN
jgi:hypothetical protein